MDNRGNIKYTEAATARMEKLRSNFDLEIEAELRERKFIPGEEVIEVTGSDVDELAQSMKVVFYKSFARRRKRTFLYLFLNLYLGLGIITIAFGFFYEQLVGLFDNPVQLVTLASGILLTLVSFFVRQYLKIRESSEQELFREKHPPKTTFYGGIDEGELVIDSAEYGTQDKKIVVTQNLNSLISRGGLSIEVNNRVFSSDPAPGEFKILSVVYFYGGKEYSKTVPENGILNLP